MSVIGTVAREQAQAVLDVVALAFARDPPTRFWFPDAKSYLAWWPRFAMAVGERGFDHGAVDAFDDFSAVAMWLPPGVETDPAAVEALDLGSDDDEDSDGLGALSEKLRNEMARFHPQMPHWYLWCLATDPHRQGEGRGTQLMEHRLREIDRQNQPAYLEASRPELVPYYRRFGFVSVGIIDVATVPPITPMFRAAQ